MAELTTIYMPLLNEGIDVWAPVQAEHIVGALYRLGGPMPEDQEWRFTPDSVVRVAHHLFSTGEAGLAVIDEAPAASSPDVRSLLHACPFLVERIDLSGPYSAMGGIALLIRKRGLSDVEIDRVFNALNALAEGADTDLDLLGAGALEILNDDAPTARLARRKLTGKALEMVEEMRIAWGQPDYRE